MSTTFWAKEEDLVKPARNEPPRFVTSLVKFRQVSRAVAPVVSIPSPPVLSNNNIFEEVSEWPENANESEEEGGSNLSAYVGKDFDSDFGDLEDLWENINNTKDGVQDSTAKEKLDRNMKIVDAYLNEGEEKESDTNLRELERLLSTDTNDGDQESIAKEKLNPKSSGKDREEKIGHFLYNIKKRLGNDSYTWKAVSLYLDIQRAANEENANCRLTADGFLIATEDVSENQELLLPPYEALSVSEIKEALETTKDNLELFNNTLNQNLTFVKESEGGFWNVLYEIDTRCERPAQRKGRGMGMYALETIEKGTVFDWILSHKELNEVEPGKNEYDHDSRVARIYFPFFSED